MRIVTEWLVRRVDRVGLTEAQDARMTKRGDVIVYKKVPCKWSKRERENPEWMIIETDMSANDADAYLEPEPGEEEEEEELLLKIRNKGLLLDQASAQLPTLSPEQVSKNKHPYREPFIFTKETVDQFTRVKPPAPRRF